MACHPASSLLKKSEIKFGIGDGLHAYHVMPEMPVKTCIVVSTGVHQTGAMYDGFASRLVSEGYAVFVYDHRGFGRSASYEGKGRSQAVGLAPDGTPSLAGDLRDAVVKAKEVFGAGTRVVVFGHSLGGLSCGVLATSELKPQPDGFILSNGSLWPDDAQLLVDNLDAWREKAAVDPDTVLFPYRTETGSSNDEFKKFWDSPDIMKYVEEGRPMKAAYLVSVCDALKDMNANMSKFDKPALLLRGGEDIALHELGATANLVKGASKDAPITVFSYPGKMHDIIFEEGMNMERGKNSVADDIIWWLARTEW
jgi:alpha-beta hydrolase superfamily lysophospholipase